MTKAKTATTAKSVDATEEIVVIKTKADQALLDREIKRALGLVKKGRPINPESAKQKREAEIQAKKDAGIPLHQGRPPMTEEEKAAAAEAKAQRENVIKQLAAKIVAERNKEVVSEVKES